ncbi:hypothetical protein DPEC_G00217610 [Dallia pectoralis]|uniref:Uncharacterized protein n=1 Tax=Dallia pectoralis TaxID=75939 RepID=A0ACC2G302_DALPE|nr:hypothetical protein DPEC_G00217610 [Dallia pectoralis]
MGTINSKAEPPAGSCLPDLLIGPVKDMVDAWGTGVSEQVVLWHKVSDFPLKGTFSEARLTECRRKLEEYDKASVPALTPQPLSVSAAPTQPTLYPKLEDLENSPSGFDPPSTSTPFHPTSIVSPEQAPQPASMTTRSRRSGDPDRAFLMAPLVAYPNPHAQPGEGENGHYEWRLEVTVQKTWRQDELKDISKELPDPIKDSVEFRDHMEKMVRLYQS